MVVVAMDDGGKFVYGDVCARSWDCCKGYGVTVKARGRVESDA
jgi:hypothetical protein